MATHTQSIWNPQIVQRAIGDSFRKLHPRTMAKNPVMFVVEVGSVLTTLRLVYDAATGGGGLGFELQITFWLWITVLFANFAEAMAEGRGKAQADTLRRAKTETVASRERPDGTYEVVPAPELRKGDIVRVTAGEVIPADGDIIEGVASVDESAITGESAPVIRESGGDRSAVTGGTKVLSDWIRIQVTANPGETFLDRMIALVEGRRAPEDAERDRAQHPPGRADDRLPDRRRHPAAVCDLLGRAAIGVRAGLAARVSDPDDDRRPAVGDRHRRHGPAGAAQRPGDVGARGRSRRRRPHAAAGQDRDDHARQPSGDRVRSAARHQRRDGGRRGATGVLAGRNAGGSIDRRAGEGEVRTPWTRAVAAARDVRPVHSADADVRRRPARAARRPRDGGLRSGR